MALTGASKLVWLLWHFKDKMGKYIKVFKNKYITHAGKEGIFTMHTMQIYIGTLAATQYQLNRLQIAQIKLLKKIVTNGTKRNE